MRYIISLKPLHKLFLGLVLVATLFSGFSQPASNPLSDNTPVPDQTIAGSMGRCSWGSGSCS